MNPTINHQLMQKSILFIEDEAALQKTVADFFRTKGYGTSAALDGELGIKLAKEKKPDLILLDLILPKKNGFDVLRALKADPETNSIPVIVLTNLSEMEDINEVLELGANTYLVKSDHTLKDIFEKAQGILGPPE